MCLIIYKPKANQTIPQKYIDNAMLINQDGFGITFLDDGETIKTADYQRAESLLHMPRPYVAHFRYATQGAINEENMHPAPFSKGWLFSNGTVPTLGTKKKSDTRVVAEYLEDTPEKHWAKLLSMTDTRFAVVSHNLRVRRYGKWHKRKGVYYSKDNCFRTSYAQYGYGSSKQYPCGFDIVDDDEDADYFGRHGWYDNTGAYWKYTDEDQSLRDSLLDGDSMDEFLDRNDYPYENAIDDASASQKSLTVEDPDLRMDDRQLLQFDEGFKYEPALNLNDTELIDMIDQLETVHLNKPLSPDATDALEEYYTELDRRTSLCGYDVYDANSETSRSGRVDEYDEYDDHEYDNYITSPANESLPSNHELVAVYGTLKNGQGNHHHHLGGGKSSFVGSGRTAQKLRMADFGIPYVYAGEHKDGHNLVVDVFKPSSGKTWAGLDCLEGVPTHYHRKETTIILDSGEEVTAWMYYASHQPDKGADWIDNYKGFGSKSRGFKL